MPSRLRNTWKLWGHLSRGHGCICKTHWAPRRPQERWRHHLRMNFTSVTQVTQGKLVWGMTTWRGIRASAQLSTWINCGCWSASRHGSMQLKPSLELLPSLLCDQATMEFWRRESSQSNLSSRGPHSSAEVLKGTLWVLEVSVFWCLKSQSRG